MILKKIQFPKKKNTTSVITFRGAVLSISLLVSLTLFSKPFTAAASVPIITSSTVAGGITGAAFTYTITASNTPTSFAATTLPSGLTLNTSTGVISGTPATAGNYIDTVSATNASGTGTQIITIVVISAWSLTGNSGTTAGTNFIGTLDNKDFYFSMNNQHAARLNTSLLLTSFGVNCLNYNTTGSGNTGFGANVLFGINTGSGNAAFGANSLYHGNGSYNTAMGNLSLYNSAGAYSNTAIGCTSLYNDTTGVRNTAVGDSSLFANISGSNNTVIGYKADVSASNVSSAIALGYNAKAAANQLAISDSIHTIKAAGLSTGAGYVLTDVAGNGNLSLQPAKGSDSTAWKLTGNAGTNPSVNFIGTTDNQNLVFKRGNKWAGVIDSTLSNTSLGVYALASNTSGTNNAAFGFRALQIDTSGGSNAAFGYRALSNNTSGSNNAGFGYQALVNNTSGGQNVGIGPAALGLNQSGAKNTAVGASSSYANVSGVYNTSMGYFSLEDNTASYNTAIGSNSLNVSTSGSANTALGDNSMSLNTSGGFNTALGYNTLLTNLSGNYNTAIGDLANVTDTNTTYALSLGYAATATSKQLAISDSIHTIKAKGLPTGAGYVLTDVSGNGNLSLQPITGGATAWSLSGNTPASGSSYLGSSNNVSLRFKTNSTEKMIIDSVGRVGIGVTNITDTGYKLYVEKGIRTRKVKVDISSWADFVFDMNYKLSSLADVENYIQQNKHLPDVPSANDVEKNGIDLGTNQKILLQKIEELTLYIIDQNKKIEVLQNQNEQLQQLKKEMDDLKMLLQKNK
jgi:hypothetical protein